METQNKRHTIGWIIIVLLALALVALFYHYHEQSKKMSDAYKEEAAQIQAGQDEISLAQAEIFEGLASGMDLPEFVFWGDESMAGNADGDLPAAFSSYADEKVFGDIGKRFSQIQGQNIYDTLQVKVENMGIAGEGMNEIMTRTGAHQLVTAQELQIPARRDKVNIDFRDEQGHDLRFEPKNYTLFGSTEIDGIEGKIYKGEGEYDTGQQRLAFARRETGEELTVPAGTDVNTESANKYKGCLPVLFFDGGIETDPALLTQELQEILEYNGTPKESYLVVVQTEEGQNLDRLLQEAFPEHYIRWDKPVGDMTEDDYSALAEQVYDSLDHQDCFKKARSAVKDAKKQLKELE